MVKSAGQCEREAAEAIRPIFERGVKDLRLGRGGAAALVLHISEAYARGRADEAEMSGPHRDVSTTGMAIVLMMQPARSHPDVDGDHAVLALQQIGTNVAPGIVTITSRYRGSAEAAGKGNG